MEFKKKVELKWGNKSFFIEKTRDLLSKRRKFVVTVPLNKKIAQPTVKNLHDFNNAFPAGSIISYLINEKEIKKQNIDYVTFESRVKFFVPVKLYYISKLTPQEAPVAQYSSVTLGKKPIKFNQAEKYQTVRFAFDYTPDTKPKNALPQIKIYLKNEDSEKSKKIQIDFVIQFGNVKKDKKQASLAPLKENMAFNQKFSSETVNDGWLF